MPEANKTKTPVYLTYLDSVRGIAATLVVIYHFVNWRYADRLSAKLTSIIFNGSDAVAFFFVLSGFVLSYKYIVLKHKLDIGKFYINRFFRLWPAFFVTVIINMLYQRRAELSWENLPRMFFTNDFLFWEEALLIRPATGYYTPGWTLVIELLMSMFIPFAIVIAHKNKKLVLWVTAYFMFLGNSLALWTTFIPHFMYGVLVATFFMPIVTSEQTKNWIYKYRWPLFIVGFILFSMRHIEKIHSLGSFYDNVIYEYLGYEASFFTGFGAFILLVLIMSSSKVKKVLEHRILKFIGRISYGIYLMHWLIVTYIFVNWDRLIGYFPNVKIAFFVLLIACIAITYVLATLTYYFIEVPLIRWGKKLTSRMKPTIVVEP